MPRGDKSRYTDKQERKAGRIAESYEARGAWRRKKLNAGPGLRSTRMMAVERSLADRGEAPTPAARLRIMAGNWAGEPRRRVVRPTAPPRLERRPPRASETPSLLDRGARPWLRETAPRGVAVCAGE